MRIPPSSYRFGSRIVNYADDLCVLGKAPAAEMLAAAVGIMDSLKLTVSERKTRCLRCPEEPLEFLGCRIGRRHRPKEGGSCTGTRPSRASVRSTCHRVSGQTAAEHGLISAEEMVERLNRMLSGWANHCHLGQVSPAYAAVDAHAAMRFRQWLCRKHRVRCGKYVRYPDQRLWEDCGGGSLRLPPPFLSSQHGGTHRGSDGGVAPTPLARWKTEL